MIERPHLAEFNRAKLMVVSETDEKAGSRSALCLFLISVFPGFF